MAKGYDRLDSLLEGFGTRVAIGDLDDKVKKTIIDSIGAYMKAGGIPQEALSKINKDLEDELTTVYFNIETLDVEEGESIDNIAKVLEIEPSEVISTVEEILSKLPSKDLGKYESVDEDEPKVKMFEAFLAEEEVTDPKVKDIKGIQIVPKKTYDYMLDVMPPIYIGSVDGVKVTGGYAVSEPNSEFNGQPTFNIYFKVGSKYYTAEATIKKNDSKPVSFGSYNSQEFTRDNEATSVVKEK